MKPSKKGYTIMSDFERVKEAVSLKAYAEAVLDRAHGGLVCPACKSGTGKSKTPAFSVKGEKWKCFSCQAGGDVFDLAGHVHHLQADDRRGQLRAVADWAGIPIEDKRGGKYEEYSDWTVNFDGTEDEPRGAKGSAAEPEAASGEKKEAGKPNYSQGQAREAAKIKEAQERLQAETARGNAEPMQYLYRRGFTTDEIARIGFGYIQTTRKDGNGWKNQAGEWVNGGRIVIPWKHEGKYYHLDRAMTDEPISDRKYVKPKKDDVGEQPVIWNKALVGGEVFVCEGLLDAYAIEVMGYHAVPLAGTAYDRTLRAISSFGYKGTVILALDGDDSGRTNQEKAAELCETLKLTYYAADFTALTGAKDACEAMAENRTKAREALETIRLEAKKKADEGEADAQREAYEALHVQEPGAIAEAIWNCDGYEEPISTGFYSLDNVMNGGLRSGLVVFGAVSSAGKTTLMVQIADYIAAHDRPVLFVTIEQSGREIVAKSLSRMMARRDYKAVILWEMGNSKLRERWPEAKTAAFLDCLNEYTRTIAPRLFILSADEQPTIDNVKAAARAVARNEGVSPVIFIDYLQLLAPKDKRMTDKQSADYNVSGLRRLARDMKTPVITISSLNRASYSGNIEMESFKESGGIEYGADLLIGLQPYHMEERIDEGKGGKDAREKRAKDITNEYRKQGVRQSELVILKNRNGHIPSEPLPLTFYAASSLFVEGV